MKVAIIILNWNGWRDTIECLESVYRINYNDYDVIIVDNGSNDNSVEAIRRYCDGSIHLIEYSREVAERGGDRRIEKKMSKVPSNRKLRLILNEKNYGFAMGNNIGITYALKALRPRYVVLLNNDTVVDPNFLKKIIDAMEELDIGIAGPKVCRYDKPNVVESLGGVINVKRCEFPHIHANSQDRFKGVLDVDYVTGCCMAIREDVFRRVGLFDPVYFCYVEEVDFCYRAKARGYRIAVVADAKIWHKGGRSSGGDFGYLYNYYRVRNKLIFLRKHIGFKGLIRANPFIMASSLRLLVKARRFKREMVVLKGILKGIVDGFRTISSKEIHYLI